MIRAHLVRNTGYSTLDIDLERVEVTVTESTLTTISNHEFWWDLTVDLGPGFIVRVVCSRTVSGLSTELNFDPKDANIWQQQFGDEVDFETMALNMVSTLLPDREMINLDLNPVVTLQ